MRPVEGKMRVKEKAEAERTEARLWTEIPSAELKGCFNERDLLGEGGFKRVYRGVWRESEVAVAKLLVPHMTEEDMKDFRAELNHLSQLNHKRIVLLYGACTVSPDIALVTELMKVVTPSPDF